MSAPSSAVCRSQRSASDRVLRVQASISPATTTACSGCVTSGCYERLKSHGGPRKAAGVPAPRLRPPVRRCGYRSPASTWPTSSTAVSVRPHPQGGAGRGHQQTARHVDPRRVGKLPPPARTSTPSSTGTRPLPRRGAELPHPGQQPRQHARRDPQVPAIDNPTVPGHPLCSSRPITVIVSVIAGVIVLVIVARAFDDLDDGAELRCQCSTWPVTEPENHPAGPRVPSDRRGPIPSPGSFIPRPTRSSTPAQTDPIKTARYPLDHRGPEDLQHGRRPTPWRPRSTAAPPPRPSGPDRHPDTPASARTRQRAALSRVSTTTPTAAASTGINPGTAATPPAPPVTQHRRASRPAVTVLPTRRRFTPARR